MKDLELYRDEYILKSGVNIEKTTRHTWEKRICFFPERCP